MVPGLDYSRQKECWFSNYHLSYGSTSIPTTACTTICHTVVIFFIRIAPTRHAGLQFPTGAAEVTLVAVVRRNRKVSSSESCTEVAPCASGFQPRFFCRQHKRRFTQDVFCGLMPLGHPWTLGRV